MLRAPVVCGNIHFSRIDKATLIRAERRRHGMPRLDRRARGPHATKLGTSRSGSGSTATGPAFASSTGRCARAIVDGTLAPGAQLPATRALAARARRVAQRRCCSRASSSSPRATLAGGTRSGTYVQAAPAPRGRPRSRARRRSAATALGVGRRAHRVAPAARCTAATSASDHLPYDFRYGEPSIGGLPARAWRGCLGRRARRARRRAPRLRAAGRRRRAARGAGGIPRRARGVVCEPERLLIVNGSQQAIDLAARLLVDPGDRVVSRSRGYRASRYCAARRRRRARAGARSTRRASHPTVLAGAGARAARVRHAVAPVSRSAA